ncbi:MAG: alpha-amylase family glycosyl hydrolase [Fimbriimonas sp.]|nr:alpha-amylase family glycosyl hydrolase [Fimbriimonas sp.]
MLSVLAALTLSTAQTQPVSNPWESQVFYQVFPRSFRDSNGDRIGDFKGIEEGLPTIQKLGATVILINPIQKSRVYHDYFADDWTDVDPTFGTLSDFDHLLAAAHKLHIRVVIDMEQQYVASRHPWYVAAAKDPNAPEAEYLAKPFHPNPDALSPWYDHAKIQLASVNLNNPHVIEEIGKVFRFWSARGVDGYRIDHMMDDLDWTGQSTHLYARLWKPVEEDIKLHYPGTFFVGEQSDWEAYRSSVEMFEGTPTDACYNFRLRDALLTFKKGFIAKNLQGYRYFTNPGRLQLSFLENHDMNRFASEELDPVRQRLAAALMIFAKGAPILYYGQEIGMKGEQGQWNSDGNDIPVRLAYRWNRKLDAAGTALWYKDTGPWWSLRYSRDDDGRSLEEQENDPKSLFNWYRKMIAIRQSSQALMSGSQEVIDSLSETVLAFRRQVDGHAVLVLANMSDKGTTLTKAVWQKGEDLVSGETVEATTRLRFSPWQIRVIDERS